MENKLTLPRDLINTATKMLEIAFQLPLQITATTQLSEEGRRNLILRLTIESSSDRVPRSIILKKTSTESMGETEQEQLSRFAHDWAGLEFLHQIGGKHAPSFYGGNVEHRFILIEDLGTCHPSLVGPLTRPTSPSHIQEAEEALEAYARRIGRMHADTFGKTDLFVSILNRIYPQSIRYHQFRDEHNTHALELFKTFVGVDTVGLSREIQDIFDSAQSPSSFKVFLHGDICPDNIYLQTDDLRLIDFEYGDVGHAFIDGVYPRMSMPSCWCARTIPASTLSRIEKIYRDELKLGITAVGLDTEYTKGIAFGCAYWTLWIIVRLFGEGPIWKDLMNSEWNCPSGPTEPDSIWDPSQNAYRPRILTRLQSFISASRTSGSFPKLREATEILLVQLRQNWPDTPFLGIFPVFESKK